MINRTGIIVTNLTKSKIFYTHVLRTLGYRVRLNLPVAVGFGDVSEVDPEIDFWISAGKPSVPRNHIAFQAHSEEEVRAFYQAAIDAGAKANGEPAFRPLIRPQYYAAFVYDLDGYNIEAVFHEKMDSK